MFLQFKAYRELESGYKIKAVRCDNGLEYVKLGSQIKARFGIPFEYTTVYTPEQNRVSEYLNRILV